MKKCRYCGGDIEYKDTKVIYGKSYGKTYICSNFPKCDTYGGYKGHISNKETRDLRKKCHFYFDKLWRSGEFKREYMYRHLQKKMGMTSKQAHIGKFNRGQCLKLLSFLTKN